MGSLKDHAASTYSHLLCIGNNGSGKTGALASLAKAGYKLRILDYDNGVEILANYLKDTPFIDNVDAESFIDPYHAQPGTGTLRAKDSVAFEQSMKCLANWPKYGSPTTWGTDTILVVDSLTAMGRATMNHVFKLKGKLLSLKKEDIHPSQPDWGDAMGLQENFLAMLGGLKCHVIVNAHVTFVQQEGAVMTEGFPSALGSKLPPKVGSYFNSTLYFGNDGIGTAKTRTIFTKTTGAIATKTSAPDKVKDKYSLATGLADYFKDVHGPLKPAT